MAKWRCVANLQKALDNTLLLEFAIQQATAIQYHPVLFKVIEYMFTGWSDSISELLKLYHYHWTELSIENLHLLWGNTVISPLNLQSKVLGELHDNRPGVNGMKA